MRYMIRYGYVPSIGGIAAIAIWFASQAASRWSLVMVVVAGIGVSFGAERLVPVDPVWNRDKGDARRDLAHAAVNETLTALSLALLPVLATAFTITDAWPQGWPFAAQVLVAIVVFDFGITLAHMTSHRYQGLWRFHAVHHSIGRLYGLNGLMKHPVHQLIETTAGIAPLLAFGITGPVAAALAACVALQLLLQHSNVDYRVGAVGRVLALNSGHRLHHLRWPGVGDVNFGLFTLIWDRLLGTYTPPGRTVTSNDLGIAARPDYPSRYLAQLTEPFRHRPLTL